MSPSTFVCLMFFLLVNNHLLKSPPLFLVLVGEDYEDHHDNGRGCDQDELSSYSFLKRQKD
jgi:hypothetical protein